MNQVKNLLGKGVLVYLRVLRIYFYDLSRFYRHSNVKQLFVSEDAFKGRITILYHVIEKGLTMPETRLGFGIPVVNDLMDLLIVYSKEGKDVNILEFKHSAAVLEEYFSFHQERGFDLPKDLIDKYLDYRKVVKSEIPARQLKFTRDQYFKSKNEPFEQFALSRYSCRNYSQEEIPNDILEKCVKLAMKSPTSCNRQLNRIYVVKNKETRDEVLKLQYGNRGFGHLASTLFILTANISYFQGVNDRNESYINTGMFAMSLLNALHHYEIGACPLNWSVDHKRDQALRELLGIPDNERIGLVISCGFLPDHFEIASSPRLEVNNIAKFFN
ncbi:nitroreductase family protein [Sphingobacterium bambusae]|uniref:Nitroreductase family protein n=1 Tax=Sphingobacterium bambusae TaxID=662858 RepID=A0ABW6BFA3_9SPHI|nr:nitroreductase family protein [Sphingobacterium bambusae]WPL46879.1 nitroreductase family protein [Sphingobacterium bambusae]